MLRRHNPSDKPYSPTLPVGSQGHCSWLVLGGLIGSYLVSLIRSCCRVGELTIGSNIYNESLLEHSVRSGLWINDFLLFHGSDGRSWLCSEIE